jgi:hypothetical protein
MGSARGGSATTSILPLRRDYKMRCCHLPRPFGNRHCCLPLCHFCNTWHCCLLHRHGITWRHCLLRCHSNMIIFGHTAMAIGGIDFFSLTTMGLCSVVFRHGTLVGGIIVFGCTMSLQQYMALSSAAPSQQCTASTTFSQNKDSVAKLPATEGKQQATTSGHNERTRGWCNTNTSTMTAMEMMTLAAVTATTVTTTTTTLAVAASIEV